MPSSSTAPVEPTVPHAVDPNVLRRSEPLHVAVTTRRVARPNPWQAWRFEILAVEPDASGQATFEVIDYRDGLRTLRQHGLAVALHHVEADGYALNLDSGHPSWFVHWRILEDDPSEMRVEQVMLSYLEAGRLLDAGENVETVPLPAEVARWLAVFTAAHHVQEPRQRRRPASFRRPEQRG